MSNYYIFRTGMFLARLLPRRISLALVTLACDLHFYFSKKDRQAVESNLKIIHGVDHVPASEVRAVFRHFGEYLLDFFTMTQRVNPAYIKEHVKVNNINYLQEVLSQGKGAILISAHLGNWEMAGAVLPLLGFPLSVLALAHQDKRVNTLFNAQREAFGVQVIQTDKAVRSMAEHLQQNRFIAIIGDRDFGQRGLLVDFFGRKVMIPKGAAAFSLKLGVPLIPGFFIRRANDHFEINVYPPMYPPPLVDGKVTDEVLLPYIQHYVNIFESEIRKNPSQWLLFRELESS